MNFLKATKYARTMHFDFSQSLQNDDRRLETMEHFIDREVVLTEKMDGENATIYTDYYHPRSVIDDGHTSRNWLKGFIPNFQYKIPENWRVCGESLYAAHAIKYDNLTSFFYAFSIWNDNNMCISWDAFVSLCEDYGVHYVPVLYRGVFDYGKIKNIYENLDFDKQEGVVCRIVDEFHYDDFQKYVAKAVRPNHVQATDEHWKKTWKPNKLEK